MQSPLFRVVVFTFAAILLEAVYVNQQLSDVVWAFAVQAGNHVGNFRQLLGLNSLWVTSLVGTIDNRLLGFDGRFELVHGRWRFNAANAAISKGAFNTPRCEGIDHDNPVVGVLPQRGQSINGRIWHGVALDQQGAVFWRIGICCRVV